MRTWITCIFKISGWLCVSVVVFAWSVPYSWIRARCVVRTFRRESDSFRTCPDTNSQSQDSDTPPSFHPIQVLSKRSRLTDRIMRLFQDGMLQLKMSRKESWMFSWGEKEGGNGGRKQEIGRKMCTPKIVTPSQRGKREVEQFLRRSSIISRNMTVIACLAVHALCTQESV